MVLLLIEVVVVEVHNLMEVVLTAMLFQVGRKLKPQMLLSQVLFQFFIDQLLYYLIQALLILMFPHILLLVWIYCVSLLICRYAFLPLSGSRSGVSFMYCYFDGV